MKFKLFLFFVISFFIFSNDINTHGNLGYINTPSALSLEDGTVATTIVRSNPDRKLFVTASPFKWLDASIFYVDVTGREYNVFKQSYKDKGFSDKKITIDRKNPNDPNIGVSTDRKTIEVWAHPKRPKALKNLHNQLKRKKIRTECEDKQLIVISEINDAYSNFNNAKNAKNKSKQANLQKLKENYENVISKHKDLLPHSFLGPTLQIQINDGIDAKGHGLAVKRGTVTHMTANTDRTQDSLHIPISKTKFEQPTAFPGNDVMQFSWMDISNHPFY